MPSMEVFGLDPEDSGVVLPPLKKLATSLQAGVHNAMINSGTVAAMFVNQHVKFETGHASLVGPEVVTSEVVETVLPHLDLLSSMATASEPTFDPEAALGVTTSDFLALTSSVHLANFFGRNTRLNERGNMQLVDIRAITTELADRILPHLERIGNYSVEMAQWYDPKRSIGRTASQIMSIVPILEVMATPEAGADNDSDLTVRG